MPYVSALTTKSSATKAATLAFATTDLPVHAADDYLVIGITCEADAASPTHTCSAGGFTQIGATTGSSTTLWSSMWYLKCTGAAHNFTVTFSATAASHGHAFLVKDANLTTFLDGTPSAANVAAASQFNSASITTANADALVLFYIGVDATTTTPVACHSAPGAVHFLDSSDNGGANVTAGSAVMAGAAAGWYVQRAAGATPTPPWNMSASNVTNRFTVGINQKSGGVVPPYIDDTATIGTKLMDGHRWASASTFNNENFKATPLTVTSIITHLGTLTGTFDAGASVVDVHLNPYSAAVSSTPATSASALTGFELGFPTTTIDMTTGWIVGAIMESTPKAANFNMGSIATGGVFLSIGKTTNYRIFQILAKDNLVNCEGRAVFSVQPNQTQTQSGQSASAPTIGSIDKICILQRGNTATMATYCCDFHLINKIVAAGGTASAPVDTEGMYQIGKFLRLKLIQKQASGGLLAIVPVQIGGGDAINFNIDAGALQFPCIYSRAAKDINYHGANNAIGISYAGKSGDTIKHTNSVVASVSPFYWEINSAATSAATWDFGGLVISGANVTLRNVMTFDGMTFTSCPALVFTACALTGCTINKVPATSGTVTTGTTATLTSCAIDVSLITAGNYWWAGADPSAIFTGCAFKGGGGHALQISAAGGSSITLTGNTWTGFGADGSTGAALNFTATTGAITVNISGGTTPTYKTAGATITISNPRTKTFTGLPEGTEVRVRQGSFTLSHSDSVSGGSYAYQYQINNTVARAQFTLPGYVFEDMDITLNSTDQSLPVTYAPDPSYTTS